MFLQNSTLEKEKLKSGDILLIEEGKLPPKVSEHHAVAVMVAMNTYVV